MVAGLVSALFSSLPMTNRRAFLRDALAAAAVPLTSAGLALAQRPLAKDGDGHADISTLLESIRKESDVPALAGAAIKDGRTVALGAVGVRKAGDETPVTVGDQFHLGSCTKAMTATLAGMFVEQGKLAWDSTLAKTLPELADKMHADLRDVTLEHLLQHRSGQSENSSPAAASLWKLLRDKKLTGTPREQRRTYAEMILAEKPDHSPGSKFAYSNRNYSLVGVMLETLAGKPWEELITERLFRPLGMTSAGFGAMGSPAQTGAAAKTATKAKIDQPWQHRMLLGLRVPVEPGPQADNPDVIGPAGKVHCSLADWTKYLRCHVRGEKGDGAGAKGNLLKPETYQRLHRPAFGGNYAGGWIVAKRPWAGGRVLTHDGSNTQNYAVAWLAPLRDFAVLAATNQGGDEAAKACDQACSGLIGEFLKG
jgi:CubicO group peptidase (beta-lactamase class C family)